MATPVKCTECDGRGWKIVTRRGCVAAMGLHMEQSSREDCLYCDGPEQLAEMFEWEVFLTSGGTEELGPCGTGPGQATSMDALRTALLRLETNVSAWGRIIHRVYDFGTLPDDWSRHVIFRTSVDPAGAVRFERVSS
ncbi:hypothetical protein GCM10010156_76870 [Planobispora rosea]|uniref:Uncharacterized protein n=1 Tax=Planobispora rosea TaxID=35762 RepID=A0A8J3WGD2_PLARO|nr:hypothetical protein [Planobispora rosea]GGT08504.1 hypothetical protein GCM10010156_76870 [Planobispora rosea]GIH89194.1 hypothetical protein Pro02_76020 [Planobispora rosea]